MSAYPNIMFLDSKLPITIDSLNLVLDAMLRLGFKAVETKTRDAIHEWNAKSSASIFAKASLEKLLVVRYVNSELNFEVNQEIRWNAEELGGNNRAWIKIYSFNTAYFWNSVEESERYSELLLKIGIELYNILSPTFGWIDFNFGIFTTHEDIESVKLPVLYWANFFGPRFVDKLSKQRIESAPNWKLERLADGGYLYVLSSGIGLSRYDVSSEEIKLLFGVEKVR